MIRDVESIRPYLKVFWSGDDVYNHYDYNTLKTQVMHLIEH